MEQPEPLLRLVRRGSLGEGGGGGGGGREGVEGHGVLLRPGMDCRFLFWDLKFVAKYIFLFCTGPHFGAPEGAKDSWGNPGAGMIFF